MTGSSLGGADFPEWPSDAFPAAGLPDASTMEPSGASPFPIVALGASAGGVAALQAFFRSVTSDPSIAFVVTMHLDPERHSHLSEILARATQMKVLEVERDALLAVNCVYVIPPRFYGVIRSGHITLRAMLGRFPKVKAVDLLFSSLAYDQRERAVCIVLSGADHDGTIGLKAVKAEGGMVMAQSRESASHSEMPESARKTGLVDYVLPVDKLFGSLLQYIENSELWRHPVGKFAPIDESEVLGDLLQTLRAKTGADFNGYKEGTLLRRSRRRMALLGLHSLRDYDAHVKADAAEASALASDMLIGVTEFFREPTAWSELNEKIVPKLIAHANGGPVRIWVPACATGEEAYSMAMLFLDHHVPDAEGPTVNVIGSDLDGRALAVARTGSYAESINGVITPEGLTKYFDRGEGGCYVAKRRLRESILFSQHNLIADPPFSRIDLISCRNLLIYLKPEIQRILLEIFYFALQPGGYLFLGKSETIGSLENMFEVVSAQSRIYRSVGNAKRRPVQLPIMPGSTPLSVQSRTLNTQKPPISYATLVRDLVAQQHSVAAILVDGHGNARYFHGPTEHYLLHPERESTQDILAMVYDDLRVAVRAGIQSARAGHSTDDSVVTLVRNVARRTRVRAQLTGFEDWVLVTFEQDQTPVVPHLEASNATDWAVQQLECDLQVTRYDLGQSIGALQNANAELRIAHEEAMSLNEELQSANEELETSREELQSINEELTTVNADLQIKIEDLASANDDLSNLFSASDLPTLFLDRMFCIKRFTPAAEALFNLIPTDVGRCITDISARVDSKALVAAAATVLETLAVAEQEIRTENGDYFLRRVLPYRTKEDRVEGVVAIYIPASAIRRAEQDLRESELRFRNLADDAPVVIGIAGPDGKLEFVNRRLVELTGRPGDRLLGCEWQDLIHPDDAQEYTAVLKAAIRENRCLDQEARVRNFDGSFRWMRIVTNPRYSNDTVIGSISSAVDIEAHKHAEAELRNADKRKDEFLAILGHELRNPLSPIKNAADALRFVESDDYRLLWAREMIARQVSHMTRLVDDLLDVARLTRGTLVLRREPVDMELMVRTAVDVIRPQATARGQTISVETNRDALVVDGDPVRLTQILENLLANASKFSEDNGQIAVHLRGGDNYAVVSVSDNGRGISPHMLDTVFELFKQEERSLRQSGGGLGVGLALVRQLTLLHGGSVEAFSGGVGQGSEFTVRLPLAELRPESEARTDTKPHRGTGRVLVVDDNKDSADAISLILREYGYETRTAYDFSSALTAAATFQPQAALLDLSHPEPNGLELAKRFRQSDQSARILLVAVSGYGQPEDMDRSKIHGIDHHIVKPIDPDFLHRLFAANLDTPASQV